ncbi:unnamed protein product [Orchesella dallaii]|uniref:Uncharacterized protein n=1 Tax=Orchesella dallaii TaxID=48710 RepID=A0ABP1PZV1_9HEXA
MANKGFIFLAICLGMVASATIEERQMPGVPYGPPGFGGYDTALSPYGAPAPPGGYAPPYGMQGFPDPGFSIQTGFEGYLVPNSWYGLMPWGVEGVVVVITGVIVFVVIAVVILGLLAWLCGFGDYAIVKEAARSFMPSLDFGNINLETLADITSAVFDALDKYNELTQQKKLN